MDNYAERYRDAVRERSEFLRRDLRAYLYLRLCSDWATLEKDIGGGNYSGPVACFALLGLLAKVHRAIEKPEKFALKRLRETLPACKACGRATIAYETNESNAFAMFTSWLEDRGVGLGVIGNDAQACWTAYRNWLVHRFSPKHLIVAFVREGRALRDLAEVDARIDNRYHQGERPLRRVDGERWELNVDLLYVLLEPISIRVAALIQDSHGHGDTGEVLDYLLLGIEPADVQPRARSD